MAIEAQRVRITPAMAREMLQGNTSNRPLRPKTVEYLSREILAGRWMVTADGIGIDSTGRLINGQHRLQAIIRADRAVDMIVTRGLQPESFLVHDGGNPRSMADRTEMAPELAADLAMVMHFIHGMNCRPAPQQIRDAAAVWLPAHKAVMEVSGRQTRAKFTNSQVRLAVGLRWATLRTPDARNYVLTQYGYMLNGDLEAASKAIRALWRRLTEAPRASGRDIKMVSAASIYHHFDPVRAGIEPVVQRVTEIQSEMRQWLTMMEDAYAAGPTRQGHPYAWSREPLVERALVGAAAQRVQQARASAGR